MRPLRGLHHITAITSSAERNYQFFTYILGMRLVKKTVNQDDIQAYHLFFADEEGSPGTDVTFFDFSNSVANQRGTNEISRIGLRVPSDEALNYWMKRFSQKAVYFEPIRVIAGRKMVFFEDFDQQRYALVSDENVAGVAPGKVWRKGPIPNEYGITGLGPVFMTLSNVETMGDVLTSFMGMKLITQDDKYFVYEMGEGGNGASVFLELDPRPHRASQGYGGVHHVAFRVDDLEAINDWINALNKNHLYHSGLVDRFYFKSLYTRLYPNILFEFATDGPGFIDDEEDIEHLGEILALPPKFRSQRAYVESVVRPIDTVRSTKVFEKEYNE